jgi:pimeloyl-ACP methyl ester carboxylesterase
MAVLRFHPELVARAVLSSLEGPDHTYDDPAGVLAALERVAAAAALDPDLAPFMPAEGLIEGLRSLIRGLEAEPLTVTMPDGTTEVRIEAEDVRGLTMGYTGRVSSRAGIRTWPADILRLLHGEWAAVAPRIVFARRSFGILPTASFFMLDCGSGITAARHARYSTDPALEILVDPGAFYDATCPAWDADLGDAFRTGFSTPVPTLLVHGTWDTSTPVENAHELASLFTNSRLVIVEGGSHAAMGEAFAAEPSFRAAVTRFMETGTFDGIPDRVVLPPLDFAVPAIER